MDPESFTPEAIAGLMRANSVRHMPLVDDDGHVTGLITRMGITINTFMLDDSPSLRAFVERMTRINRGRALYTRPDRLGEYLLVDYLSQKRKKI